MIQVGLVLTPFLALTFKYPQPELGPELDRSPRPIQGRTGSQRSFSAEPLPDAQDHQMHEESSSENDDTEEESGVDEAEVHPKRRRSLCAV